MPWQALNDTEIVGPSDTLRVDIYGGTSVISFGVNAQKIRQYLTDYTMCTVTEVSTNIWYGAAFQAVLVPTGTLTVKQVRDSVVFALEQMRNEWLVVAPGMSVGEISVRRGIDIAVPVTTTVSLVAICIMVVAGFLVWSKYK